MKSCKNILRVIFFYFKNVKKLLYKLQLKEIVSILNCQLCIQPGMAYEQHQQISQYLPLSALNPKFPAETINYYKY